MKRVWIGAVLLLCLLLSGCGAKSVSLQQGQWADQVQGDMDGIVPDQWTYRLSTETVSEQYRYAENQLLMVDASYALPRMTVYHQDGKPYDEKTEAMSPAMKVVQKFNRYFDEWLELQKTNFTELATAAVTDYQKNGSVWQQPDYHYTDKVAVTFWNNDRMACVTLLTNSFTGGAHEISTRSCVTFDMQTGAVITINDMVDDYAALRDAVALNILGQIQNGKWVKYYDGATLFDDYEETIPEWMTRSIFFGDEKMTVVFSAYDIAPYSAGEQAFEVPYTLIEPYLNDYGRQMLGIAKK